MRLPVIISLTLGTSVALTAVEPAKTPAPTRVSIDKGGAVLGEVAADLSKQSGVPVGVATPLMKARCDARFADATFWDALQKSADATGARITLADGGRKVELAPRGGSKEVAAVSGAFRLVAHGVTARALLDTGAVVYDVDLTAHWEPRVRVYRIDTAPRVTKAAVDTGAKVTAAEGGSQVLPAAAFSELKVRLEGLPRKAERLTALAGEFSATVAERVLTFEFEAPGGKLPAAQKQAGVSAALTRVQKKGDVWEVAVEVNYPPGQPVFESFQGEWWLRDNRLSLRAPDGKSVALGDYEIPAPDRATPLAVIHRFKENAAAGLGPPTAKGWALVYETPAPLADVRVPFALTDIPLP